MVLLLFWYGFWVKQDRTLFFNPFLGPMSRASGTVVGFLKKNVKPLFAPLPDRVVLLIVFITLLVIRSFLVPGNSHWVLDFGFYSCLANLGSTFSRIAFSMVSFCVFLFKIWGISLIFVHGAPRNSFDHCTETIHYASKPFSNLRFDWRPLVLAVFGMTIAFLMEQVGRSITEQGGLFADRPPLVSIARYFIIALAGWANVLILLRTVLFLLIIGSWVSMFTSSQPLMHFCRTWLDFLLGPLRRYPLRVGMIDLTPLIMIFALGYLHHLIMWILEGSYLKLV
ncbi:MAG: YggT family protein [Kiritimatiellia bacterium]|nr:YggT family protein [Kiritimatiellia bacterium]